MPCLLRPLLAALVCAALALPTAAATAAPLGPDQRGAIERVVHDYLLAHPEVLVQALDKAEAALREDAHNKAEAALAEHRRGLYHDPASPIGGNPQGDATIVEFFDYQCPYCKAVEPSLDRLLRADPRLRFVYKEFPVLGPESRVAARAALAAARQGKYLPFHDALLQLKGRLDDNAIFATARRVGLDVARLKRDMADPQIAAEIEGNLTLAQALSVTGTPTFIIGQAIVPGAVDRASLERLVAAERKNPGANGDRRALGP